MPDVDTDIYIADTIGELGLFFSLAPIAFIGGSLVARGGHNPIEAVRFDTAVITGPDQSNFSDAYAALLANNGAVAITGASDLTETVALLLRDESSAPASAAAPSRRPTHWPAQCNAPPTR